MKQKIAVMEQNATPGTTGPESTDSDKWIEQVINKGLKFGGTMVTEEHYQERVKICKGCPDYGMVRVPNMEGGIPKISKTPGCTRCGCPTATKPRWEKYFSWLELRIKKAECPDQKWQEVDNQFLSLKTI